MRKFTVWCIPLNCVRSKLVKRQKLQMLSYENKKNPKPKKLTPKKTPNAPPPQKNPHKILKRKIEKKKKTVKEIIWKPSREYQDRILNWV